METEGATEDTQPPGLYYGDYLQLDKLLDAQDLESTKAGKTEHDEMLFIIVHQAYELWFKQILWEIDDLLRMFSGPAVAEGDMGKVVSRLRRIAEIQKLLIQQIAVLETMTPLDFLDFRDRLFPASGFQSVQFRVVENKLGMRREDRLLFEGGAYVERFDRNDRETVEATEQGPTLFSKVEDWLERTPFLEQGQFNFWEAYQEAVRNRLDADRAVVANNPTLTAEQKAGQLKDFDVTMRQYESVFDETKHTSVSKRGERKFSHRAFQAALFINLYRDLPALQEPNRMLELLMDVDEGFTAWRYRHAQMALRMIGRRVGTGGSAGAKYLEKSAERSKIFSDLFNITTFLVPRRDRPELPDSVVESMKFRYQT